MIGGIFFIVASIYWLFHFMEIAKSLFKWRHDLKAIALMIFVFSAVEYVIYLVSKLEILK